MWAVLVVIQCSWYLSDVPAMLGLERWRESIHQWSNKCWVVDAMTRELQAELALLKLQTGHGPFRQALYREWNTNALKQDGWGKCRCIWLCVCGCKGAFSLNCETHGDSSMPLKASYIYSAEDHRSQPGEPFEAV